MPDTSISRAVETSEAPALRQRGGGPGERLRAWLAWWPVRDVVIPFVVTRAMLVLVGWLALHLFHSLPARPDSWEIKRNGRVGVISPHTSPKHHPLVNMWSRWDAGWYHSVAKNGYQFVPGKQSNTAFFPAYPMAIRAVHAVLPRHADLSWFISGIVVSNAALLIALYYLVLLGRLDWDDATAARGALYVLVFPTTLFFSAVYSESLFLAATVASFYYARKQRWLAAGALAGLSVLTRSPGVLLGIPLLIEYLHQRRYQLRAIRPDIAALALIPACLGALLLYFEWRFGNIRAISDAQASWGSDWGLLTWPWQAYVRFFQRPFAASEVIDFTFAISAFFLTVVAACRLRPSYGVYAVSCYWFITAWGALESMPRYMLSIVPIFMLLADWGRSRIFDRVYLIAASGLSVLFMMCFAAWRWVA